MGQNLKYRDKGLKADYFIFRFVVQNWIQTQILNKICATQNIAFVFIFQTLLPVSWFSFIMQGTWNVDAEFSFLAYNDFCGRDQNVGGRQRRSTWRFSYSEISVKRQLKENFRKLFHLFKYQPIQPIIMQFFGSSHRRLELPSKTRRARTWGESPTALSFCTGSL